MVFAYVSELLRSQPVKQTVSNNASKLPNKVCGRVSTGLVKGLIVFASDYTKAFKRSIQNIEGQQQ